MASGFARYSICLPSRRTRTSPTSFRTFRCFETEGCSKPSAATISPTGRSCNARKLRISRRRGSATALKASDVVAARGMVPIYSYIGICQAFFSAKFVRDPGARSGQSHDHDLEWRRHAEYPGGARILRALAGATESLALATGFPKSLPRQKAPLHQPKRNLAAGGAQGGIVFVAEGRLGSFLHPMGLPGTFWGLRKRWRQQEQRSHR